MRSTSHRRASRSILLAAFSLALFASRARAQSATQAPVEVHTAHGLLPLCPPQPSSQLELRAGERVKFRLDVYGAEMGTLEVWLDPPAAEDRGKVALVAHARAQTSAFVNTNVGPYSTFATSRIGPRLAPISAREEVDDSGTHWLVEMQFPRARGEVARRSP